MGKREKLRIGGTMKASLSCSTEVLENGHVNVKTNIEADNREAITLTLLSLLAELTKKGCGNEVLTAINYVINSSRGLR